MRRQVAFVAIAVSSAACGDNIDKECGPQTISDARVVAPGSFEEAQLSMNRGSSVVVSFSADGALGYDLHVHVGDDVINLAEGVASSQTYAVIANRSTDHFLLWSNATDRPIQVDVTAELELGVCWLGWL